MKYDRLIFSHLPKAGGTYVRAAVREAVGGMAHCFRAPFDCLEDGRESILRRSQRKFFSSHHAYLPGTFRPEPQEFLFTWVRNPVDMAYSAYHYYGSRPERPSANFRPLWMADQVRKVHQFDTLEKYIDGMLEDRDALPLGVRDFFPKRAFDALPLGVFRFVGRVEHMEADLARLGNLVGLEIPMPGAEHVNRSRPEGTDYSYRRDEVSEALAFERAAYRMFDPKPNEVKP